MSAVILDTETTGVDAPEVIELAIMGPCNTVWPDEAVQKWMFKPSKPISLGALATHHILDEDLANFDPWPGSWPLPAHVEYVVGHNVDFDWKAIGSPNVKRICTLALARRVWPDLDSHSLGALAYFLIERQEARQLLKSAHDAVTDVEICCRVLWRLVEVLGVKTWAELWDASEKARMPTHFTFGKYGPKDGGKGMPISQVRQMDPGYIRWCLSSCDIVTSDPYWQKALTQ